MQQTPTPTRPTEGYHPTDLVAQDVPPRPRRNLLIGSALILTGALLLGSAIGNTSDSFNQQWADAQGIVLDTGNADIRVEAGNTLQVRVESRGLFGSPDISTSESGGIVTIDGTQNSGFCVLCRRPIQYVVQMPRGAEATLTTLNGDIRIRSADGAFTFTTVNGDMDVEDSRGTLTASTTNGDLDVSDSSMGQITYNAVNGDAQVDGLTQEGVFSTFNGDVAVDTTGATVQIETINGDIRLEGSLSSGSSRLATERGDVQVRLASTAGVQLSTETQFGDVDLDGFADERQDGQRTTARAGNGSSTLDIISTSGDISVRYE